MITPELLDKILLDWSYKLPDGIPDLTDPDKVSILNIILSENKLPLYEAGRDTEIASEGLVIYFSSLLESDFSVALRFLYSKENKPTKKLPITNINPKYYGDSSAANFIGTLITKYNSGSVDKKLFRNAISTANTIRKNCGGPIKPSMIDRGVLYKQLRQKAIKIAKDSGIKGVTDDKWSPADIMIYGPGVDSNLINSITLLNVEGKNEKSINGLFMTKFTKPTNGKVLGISLKQQKARAGKAKSFTTLLSRQEWYPDASTLDPKYSFYLDLAVFLNAILGSSDPARTEKKIASLIKLIRLRASIIKTLDKKVQTIIMATIKKATSKKFTSADANILYKSIVKDCMEQYNAAKTGFYEALNKEKYVITQSKAGTTSDIETILKKSACYLVAADLVAGFTGGVFNLPPAIKSISLDTNPFVALTAYAVGYSGISPTFFKLIGSTTTPDASISTFDGDGILTLPEQSKIRIQDNPEFKGMVAFFTTDVVSDNKKVHSYEIILAFKFSEILLTVEVTDMKEKK